MATRHRAGAQLISPKDGGDLAGGVIVSVLLVGFIWEAAAALLSTRTFDAGEALTGGLVAGLAVALTRALFFSMKDTE